MTTLLDISPDGLKEHDGIAIDRDRYIRFRRLEGARGPFVSAFFVDPEAYGSGATPREAMLTLADSLVAVAEQVRRAARSA